MALTEIIEICSGWDQQVAGVSVIFLSTFVFFFEMRWARGQGQGAKGRERKGRKIGYNRPCGLMDKALAPKEEIAGSRPAWCILSKS